jgi:hypothetical protein
MEKWKTKNRFPTFPSRFATTTPVYCLPNAAAFDRPKAAASRRAKGLQEALTATPPRIERSFSPASSASYFQDHLVLETKVDFRIIFRLENALVRAPLLHAPAAGSRAGPK